IKEFQMRLSGSLSRSGRSNQPKSSSDKSYGENDWLSWSTARRLVACISTQISKFPFLLISKSTKPTKLPHQDTSQVETLSTKNSMDSNLMTWATSLNTIS